MASEKTPAHVAGYATQNNALNRNSLSLLGLYGPAGNLNAIVRLPGGRTRTVQRGSRIASGQVVGIDENGVLFQKNGRTQRIPMPGS
ncbi:hypothetical protein ACUXV3_01645 [Roseobacteraceae bacterium NS-SX3]